MTWIRCLLFFCIDPNDKKRHNVDNLKVAREKVRKTLYEQNKFELKRIQQGNMQLINKLTKHERWTVLDEWISFYDQIALNKVISIMVIPFYNWVIHTHS